MSIFILSSYKFYFTVTEVASVFSSFLDVIAFSVGGVELANLLFISPWRATIDRTSDAKYTGRSCLNGHNYFIGYK